MDDEGGHRPDNTVVQQHLKMHANATHIPNGGSDVPDERLSGAIQALLARMILVEQEIDLFETFITVKGAFDHPLLHWPVYTGYENLGDVIENLDTAANNLRALIQQVSTPETLALNRKLPHRPPRHYASWNHSSQNSTIE